MELGNIILSEITQTQEDKATGSLSSVLPYSKFSDVSIQHWVAKETRKYKGTIGWEVVDRGILDYRWYELGNGIIGRGSKWGGGREGGTEGWARSK